MSDASQSVPCWRVIAIAGRAGLQDARAVLVTAGDAVTLPVVPDAVPIVPFAADGVEALEAHLGVEVVPLRLTWLPAPDWTSGSIVVEVAPLDAAPPGFRWLDAAAVREVLEPLAARGAFDRWLERHASGAPPHEPPWTQDGWLARTSEWMSEQMAATGMAPTERPRLVYQGPLAAVLKARYDGHAAYLKCAAPVFAREAAITHALARGAPGSVPDVVASEPAQNWLLMRDHGGRLLDDEPEKAWAEAMTAMAALHRTWSGQTAEVIAAGAQIRPLEDLAAALPSTVDRGLGDHLSPDARDAWRAAVPRLVDACMALRDLGLPDTLIHGDLHPGNVVVGHDRMVFVDWSDGAVSHPFIDLPTFLVRTKDPATRRRLRDAYLDGWDGARSRERLQAAAAAAIAVGSAYQVETYLVLLASMDEPDRALFDGADASWAKRAVEALDRGLDVGLS